MKQAYLALAFLITVFLLAGNAYGEDEFYYCADIDRNGFSYDKKGQSYERSGFKARKFKLKLDNVSGRVDIVEEPFRRIEYTCTPLNISDPHILSCVDGVSYLIFNTNNGKFTLAAMAGYVAHDSDSVSVSYGTCDKF